MIDSATLTSAGGLFHHCGGRIKKRRDFDVRPLLALCNGGAMRPAEVVERSARAGVCGLTNDGR